jgi:hypothetical protein
MDMIIFSKFFISALFVVGFSLNGLAQDYHKVAFGHYVVAETALNEYVMTKGGELSYTHRLDSPHQHLGRVNKEQHKSFESYLSTMILKDEVKFEPGKNYFYIRIYSEGEYVEYIWAEGAGSKDAKALFDQLMAMCDPLQKKILANR